MIRELVEFSDRIRAKATKEGGTVHNAIKKEKIDMVIVIDKNGKYHDFILLQESKLSDCEAIAAKKGKARLLLDKREETLGFDRFDKPDAVKKKYKLYLEKLKNFKDVKETAPVVKFYFENANEGKKVALSDFSKRIKNEIDVELKEEKQKTQDKEKAEAAKAKKAGSKKSVGQTNKDEAALLKRIETKIEKKYQGNIAFMLKSTHRYINEESGIIEALKSAYDAEKTGGNNTRCSVCGKTDFPVADEPHGMIKRVPEGQTSGSALVSFNKKAFESYTLTGNLNSQICSNCGTAYVEALNFLLAPSRSIKTEQGKDRSEYDHRFDFGKDTAVVFWTRKESKFNPRLFLEASNSNDLKAFFDSVSKGSQAQVKTNDFYAITLSGAAARIMVRDYIHSSVEEVQVNLRQWFQDIDIGRKDDGGTRYAPLWQMAEATRRANDSNKNDVTPSRVQTILWRAAIEKSPVPLWVLHAVVHRVRMDTYRIKKRKEIKQDVTEKDVFSLPRMALLKLVLNRKIEGEPIMGELNEASNDVAYNCGRAFALLAKIQYHAAKRDLNVGVVNRSYSSASSTPASAFGRLFKNVQHHLSKIGGANKGLAVNLEKELAALSVKIGSFPAVLNLEQQGRFALGFYQQRNKDFSKDEIDNSEENEK